MDLAGVIQQYGYAAVFAGSLLEGEAVLALAGVAAHYHHLELQFVVAIAVAGAILGDQLYFYIGRRFGGRLLARWPRLTPSIARASGLLERYDTVLVIGLRFMYGLRLAGALAVGMSRMSWWRFASLDLLGAVLWAPLVAGAGYLLAAAVEGLLTDLKHVEYAVFAALAVVGIGFSLVRRRR